MKYKHFDDIEPSNKTDFIMLYFAACRSFGAYGIECAESRIALVSDESLDALLCRLRFAAVFRGDRGAGSPDRKAAPDPL